MTDWNLSSELNAISDFLLNTCESALVASDRAKSGLTHFALIGQSDKRQCVHKSDLSRLSNVLSDTIPMRVIAEIPDEKELSLRFVDLEFVGRGNVENSVIDRVRFRYRHDVCRESTYTQRMSERTRGRAGATNQFCRSKLRKRCPTSRRSAIS